MADIRGPFPLLQDFKVQGLEAAIDDFILIQYRYFYKYTAPFASI